MTVEHDLGAGGPNDETVDNVADGTRRQGECLVDGRVKDVERVFADHLEFPRKGSNEKEAERAVEAEEVGKDLALDDAKGLAGQVCVLHRTTDKRHPHLAAEGGAEGEEVDRSSIGGQEFLDVFDAHARRDVHLS